MKCWSCNQDAMLLREDGKYYECRECGATENTDGCWAKKNKEEKCQTK